MRVLLVEDDPLIYKPLERAMRQEGYLTEVCVNGREAWERAGVDDYAAIVLDLTLPGLDGLSVLRRLRSERVATPILILSARALWSERVEGIDAGADDYVPKPFATQELLARLRAITRRSEPSRGKPLSIGPFTIDPRKRLVAEDGRMIDMSPSEFRAIRYLVHNKGRAVSSAELTEQVHGGDADVSSNAIEVLINRIRKKIGSGLIATRRGYGYVVDA